MKTHTLDISLKEKVAIAANTNIMTFAQVAPFLNERKKVARIMQESNSDITIDACKSQIEYLNEKIKLILGL